MAEHEARQRAAFNSGVQGLLDSFPGSSSSKLPRPYQTNIYLKNASPHTNSFALDCTIALLRALDASPAPAGVSETDKRRARGAIRAFRQFLRPLPRTLDPRMTC